MAAGWQKKTYRLKKDHSWRAPPGYAIVVVDRGAARFDIPREWVVIPTDDALELHDRQPPDDDCLLKVSVIYPPPGVDPRGLPLPELLLAATKDDKRGVFSRGEVTQVQREDLELAWFEGRFVDPVEGREARTRACLARVKNVMSFITMDFWPEHVDRFGPIWNVVLRSLRLGRPATLAGPG